MAFPFAIFAFVLSAVSFVATLLNTTRVSGPRLSDLTIQTGDYGEPIPLTYGSMKMAGNVIWALDIKEVATTERQGDIFGIGGTKVTTFEYFANFAVAFGEGPATGIRRVWAENKLLIDLSQPTGTGGSLQFGDDFYSGFEIDQANGDDFDVTFPSGFTATIDGATAFGSKRIRFYLGTSDQMPDGLIESIEGEGRTPAFRNTIYIVFEDLPLDDYGNRLPTIEAEIIRGEASQTNFDDDAFTDLLAHPWTYLDKTRPFMWSKTGTTLKKYNRFTGRPLLERDISAAVTAFTGDAMNYMSGPGVIESTGDLIFCAGHTTNSIDEHVIYMDGSSFEIYDSFGIDNSFTDWSDSSTAVLETGNTKGCAIITDQSFFPENIQILFDISTRTFGASANVPDIGATMESGFALDFNNLRIYVFGTDEDGTSEQWIVAYNALTALELWTVDVSATTDFGPFFYDHKTDRILSFDAGNMYKFLPSTGALDSTTAISPVIDITGGVGGDNVELAMNQGTVVGEVYIFENSNDVVYKINTEDGVVLESWDFQSITGFTNVEKVIFDPKVNCFWFSRSSENYWRRLNLAKVDQQSWTLGNVIEDLVIRSGIVQADIDASDLTQDLRGYTLSRVASARAAIEQLQRIYLFDLIETDFQLLARDLDRVSTETIPDVDIGISTRIDEQQNKIKEFNAQDVDLPRRVSLTYFDSDSDYQINTQQDQRIADIIDSRVEQNLDFPITLTSTEARHAVEQILARIWWERESYELTLLPKWVILEPSDVVTINHTWNGVSRSIVARIQEAKIGADFKVEITAVRHSEIIFDPKSLAAELPPKNLDDFIPVPLPSTPVVMDIPIIRDRNDNTGGVYLGAYPVWDLDEGGWRGAEISRGQNNNFSAAATVTTETIVGATLEAFADGPFNPDSNIWDNTNTLSVIVADEDDDLDSNSEAAMLDGAGLILVGDELVQYQNIVKDTEGFYTLDTFLRGRFGTEWSMASHVIGEQIVFIPDKTILKIFGDSTDLNQTFQYIANTLEDNTTVPQQISLTHTVANLKPYAPSHVQAVIELDGSMTITWTRRTRYDGGWFDGTGEVPLNESIEQYELDFILIADLTVINLQVVDDTTTLILDAEQLNTLTIITETALTLTNPGAEDGDLTGWTVSDAGWQAISTAQGTVSGPRTGSFFFDSGGNDTFTSMYQEVSVPAALETQVDNLEIDVMVRYYVATDAALEDRVRTAFEFYDGGATIIGSKINQAYQKENDWTLSSYKLRVPALTRTIRLYLEADKGVGTNNEGVIDDVSLSLIDYQTEINKQYLTMYQISGEIGRGFPSENTTFVERG